MISLPGIFSFLNCFTGKTQEMKSNCLGGQFQGLIQIDEQLTSLLSDISHPLSEIHVLVPDMHSNANISEFDSASIAGVPLSN